MTGNPQVSIRITEATKQALEAWALQEGRSLSNLINLILRQAVDRKASK